MYYNTSILLLNKAKTVIKMVDKLASRNVSEYVYDSIRMDILTLVFLPEMKLSEQAIALELNASKTPIREAMIKLSYEKLVDIYPQRGTFVSKIDFERVSESYFCRVVLEDKVMRLAINNMSDVFIKKCEDILEKHQNISDNEYKEHFYYDELFHRTIFESVGKMNTWTMLDTFGTDYKRIRFLALVDYQKMKDVVSEHRNILDAIINHDEVLVQCTIKKHLQKIHSEINKILENHGEYFKNTDIDKSLVFDKNIFK